MTDLIANGTLNGLNTYTFEQLGQMFKHSSRSIGNHVMKHNIGISYKHKRFFSADDLKEIEAWCKNPTKPWNSHTLKVKEIYYKVSVFNEGAWVVKAAGLTEAEAVKKCEEYMDMGELARYTASLKPKRKK